MDYLYQLGNMSKRRNIVYELNIKDILKTFVLCDVFV